LISQATPGSNSAIVDVDIDASDEAAVILGCTEFGILLEAGDSPVPLIETTLAHAEAAVEMALQE
jgi:aspartate racemase